MNKKYCKECYHAALTTTGSVFNCNYIKEPAKYHEYTSMLTSFEKYADPMVDNMHGNCPYYKDRFSFFNWIKKIFRRN